MSKIGAEMGQLDALKTRFSTESQTVAQLRSAISSQVGNTWWEGPAATRFRGDWASQFAPMLVKLEAALQDCSKEVAARHQALLQAGS